MTTTGVSLLDDGASGSSAFTGSNVVPINRRSVGALSRLPGHVAGSVVAKYDAVDEKPLNISSDPSKMYAYRDPDSAKCEYESTIAEVTVKLRALCEHINNARESDSAEEKALLISYVHVKFCELHQYIGEWDGFDECFALLAFAMHAHRLSLYSSDEVNAIYGCLQLLQATPNINEQNVRSFSKKLERAGFNLNEPLVPLERAE